MPTKVKCFIAVLLSCLSLKIAFGWGKDAHIYINKIAAQKIPKSMPLFLAQAVEQITYLGPEPDRWREASEYTLKNAQEPDHYINLERLDGFGEMPRGRYTFYRRLYERRDSATLDRDDWLPESIGLLPYITIEVYDRLKIAFREYRRLNELNQSAKAIEQNIIFYAGWLGHYVADGANPLHVTIKHHGWIGENPNGYTTKGEIHAEFETHFISRNITPQGFADLVKAPEQLIDPFQDFMNFLAESNKLTERVYQLDKIYGFEGRGSQDALEFVNKRLAAGSQMLLNLWYSAWLESANLKQ